METKEAIILSVKRIRHALRTNGMLKKIDRKHACSRSTCNPLNELMLIQQGLLTSPPRTLCVYVCCYEAIHVCTVEYCYGAQRTSSCEISGKSYKHHQSVSSYDKNDSRTYGNVQPISGTQSFGLSGPQNNTRKRLRLTNSNINLFDNNQELPQEEPEEPPEEIVSYKQVKRGFKRKNVEQKVQNIIYNLLYGNTRKRINEKHQKEQVRTKNTQWKRYKHQCGKDGTLDIIYGMIINSNHSHDPPLEILSNNFSREQHYVQLVMQVYEKIVDHGSFGTTSKPKIGTGVVTTTHAHIDVDAVTLYVMYSMRLGQTFDGIKVIPADPYLKRYLPDVNHLEMFNLDRGKIKHGSKLLRDAYTNALKKMDVTREQLTLRNSGYIPEQAIKLFKSVSRRKKE